MKKKALLVFVLFFGLTISTSFAQDWATAIKVSTMGGNIDVYRSFGEKFNIHVGYNYFALTQSLGETIDYKTEGKIGLSSISALGDFFPFESSTFRITSGIMYNLNIIDATLTPAREYEVGGDKYSPEELGNLMANIEFNKFSPYLGLGFGNPTSGNSGFGFVFDVGTMYQGTAIVDLNAEGLLKPSANEEQAQKIQDNLSWFKWYPVLSLGLTYKF